MSPGMRQLRGEGAELVADGVEDVLAELHQIHLVDGDHECGMPSSAAMKAWRRDCGSTPLRASIRMMARFGGGSAGRHVARVLLVARACRR